MFRVAATSAWSFTGCGVMESIIYSSLEGRKVSNCLFKTVSGVKNFACFGRSPTRIAMEQMELDRKG
jgi:hypothetical protein